jgi:tryptophan-rich sensory protein
MLHYFNKSLLRSVLFSICICIFLNILIFTIPFAADTKSSATGPISSILGPLVPFIWIILFGFMGAASYFFEKSNNFINKKVNLIQFLIVLCALYPIYTLGFRSELIGLYGNLTTLISSIFLIKHLWIKSLISALLIMPTTIWLILASIWLSYEVLGLSF